MIDMEEFEDLLDEVAQEIPEKYYKNLNGGVVVSPALKIHPQSVGEGLVIMGEYQNYFTTGRMVVIYYGSFERCYGWLDREQLRVKLRETLRHELTHHWESQAGEHQLEDWDEIQLRKYKASIRKTGE